MNLDPRKIKVGLPSLKRPGGASSEPGFIANVYADLRARRLLIPLAAIAVAIVAVPVLLASDPDPVPTPTGPVSPEGAAAVSPAVLVEAPGVRNYHKRLAALKRTNPFEQQFGEVPDSARVEVASGESDPTVSVAGEQVGDPVAAAIADTTAGSTAADVSVSSDASEPGDSSADQRGGESAAGAQVSTDTGSGEVTTAEASFDAATVDVTFGPLGNAKRYTGVKRFEMLPDDKHALIAFIGLSADAKHGYFLLSSDVTETSGDGSCEPGRPAPCQIVKLAVGDQRLVTAGVEPETYRLRFTGVDREPAANSRPD